MRELVRTIRKLEKAVIQKIEKSLREGTGARGDWEEESQRRSQEFKEEGGVGEVVSEGMMSVEKEKQLICSSAASTAVQ